jgi:hypothetical protein
MDKELEITSVETDEEFENVKLSLDNGCYLKLTYDDLCYFINLLEDDDDEDDDDFDYAGD